MAISEQQIKAILALPGQGRYEHFIKRVVDQEEAWGLYQDGWALVESDEGEKAFPLWPAREYALLCARDVWSGYEPEAIPLNDLMNELLPGLAKDGVLPAVFVTPTEKGATPSVEDFLAALREEMQKYE